MNLIIGGLLFWVTATVSFCAGFMLSAMLAVGSRADKP